MDIAEFRHYADEYYRHQGSLARGRIREWIVSALHAVPPTQYELNVPESYVRIQCPQPSFLPTLPDGYGVKGGAARLALRWILEGIAPTAAPRDIDLVRYRGRATALDWELAHRFMPEDAALGQGVEQIGELKAYLFSRDLTINEVVHLHPNLYVTFRGLIDTQAFIIRPSKYRGGSMHQSKKILGVTTAKMLRLKAEGRVRGESWNIEGLPEEQAISSFDIALHLDRALSSSVQVAEEYLAELAEQRFVEESTWGVEDWIKFLADELPEGIGFFRYIPPELRAKCLGGG